MDRDKLFQALAYASLFISISTWIVDVLDLVPHCIYCQTQRTAIGVIALAMLASNIQPLLLAFGGSVLALFSAHVSSAQIFLVIKNIVFGRDFSLVHLIMATGALFLVALQAGFLWDRWMQLSKKH